MRESSGSTSRSSSALSELVKKLYKRRYLDVALFNYVLGVRNMAPTASIENALQGFYKHYDLTEDDLAMKTARQIYTRMQQEFYDTKKTCEGC